MFTITYPYTRSLMRRLYLQELWRTHGGWLISAVFLLAVAAWASLDPQYSWCGGFLAGMSVTYLGLLYSAYRSAAARLPVAEDVTLIISEAGLHVAFASVTSDIPWSAVASILRTGDGLVLNTRFGGRSLFLPAKSLTDEAKQFTIRSVIGAGGFAKDCG